MADGITVARNALTAERADLQGRIADVDRALQALSGVGTARRGRQRGRVDRVPRGSLTAGIEETLASQSAPIHADEILEALRARGSAPRGANPKASLVNALTRMAKQGKVRNTGRNHWRAS
jgi:hypothetical protein